MTFTAVLENAARFLAFGRYIFGGGGPRIRLGIAHGDRMGERHEQRGYDHVAEHRDACAH